MMLSDFLGYCRDSYYCFVLILVLLDDALRPFVGGSVEKGTVLILVLLDDALRLDNMYPIPPAPEES